MSQRSNDKADESNRSLKRPRDDSDGESVSPREQLSPMLSQGDINNSASILDERFGTIDKIMVRNFMCHKAMEIKLDPKINFIVGRNGSGKSAILMALVVGLGGKASTTNRGNSLKEFVKKGEQTSVIEITLNNAGPLGFKKDLYGDRITVVRTISNGPGPTGYKIKNANGKVVATKREELLHICTALNIQVDNPVSVLNQDTSRTFLNSTDPGDKYTLFMRATQLDEIDRLHLQAVAHKVDSVNALNVKTRALQAFKKAVDKLEQRSTALKTVPEQRRKIEALENELLWAIAIEKEKLQGEAEGLQAKLEEELRKLKMNANKEAERETKLQDLIRENQAQLAALRDESTNLGQHFTAANDKFRRSREAFNTRQREQKALAGKIQRHLANANTLRAEIDRLKQETGQETARRAEDRAERELLEEQRKAAQDTLRTCTHHYDQLRGNEEPIREQISSARADIADKNHRINRVTQNLRGMRDESSSNLAVYNPKLPALVAAIDAAHARGMFTEKPVGPLGAHIKLRDASWAPAIEQLIGRSFFSSFRVEESDKKAFFNIVDNVLGTRVGAPEVISGTFTKQVHDTSEQMVRSPGLISLLEALIITDPVVMNAVIDSVFPETVLLTPTGDDAYPLMQNIKNVPRNCKRCLTKTGEQFYPAPNYKSYCGEVRYTRAKFLQVSTRDAIRELQAELKNSTRARDVAEKTLQTLTAQLATLEAESQKVRNEREKAAKVEQKLAAQITQLQDAEEPEGQCISTLSNELAECEEEIAAMEEEARTIAVDVTLLKRNMNEAKQQASDLGNDAQTANVREQPILESTENFRSKLRACLNDKKHLDEQVKKKQLEVNDAASKIEQTAKVASEHVNNAAEVCPRISTKRKPNVITKEKAVLEVRLAEVEKAKGSYLEVTEQYHQAKEKYKLASTRHSHLETLVDYITKALDYRTTIYGQIRNDVGMRVKMYFEFHLHQRMYIGTLTVDHGNKTLEVNVSPANRASTSGAQASLADTRTLSGGERSYSTVSFIMALWDCIGMPFYFMDEFDVFMDKVNRRLILDMLLVFARNSEKKQFVFLTPQDISSIVGDKDVTIHRLEDPRP